MDRAIIHAAHLGLQRKVLLELRSQGRSLVDPGTLYRLCRIAALISESQALQVDHNEDDVNGQRSALLTIALEHHFVDFLTGCVHHWDDGKIFIVTK